VTQRLQIHPENPQARLVQQVTEALHKGAVIAYPTDSAYALGCRIGDKDALERIRQIRQVDKNHNFTLVCRNLSEISTYARVNTSIFRLLKAYTPGAYTFILEANKEVPKRLQHPKRNTIGLRIPDNKIAQAILTELNQPLLSVTLILPNEELPLADPEDIDERLHGQIDFLIDGGACSLEPTTVVDLVSGVPELIRQGKGDVTPFL